MEISYTAFSQRKGSVNLKKCLFRLLGAVMALAVVLPMTAGLPVTFLNADERVVWGHNSWPHWEDTTLSSRYPRRAEVLDRSLVAVNMDDHVFLSWRFSGFDPADALFNLYRSDDGGANYAIVESGRYLTNYQDIHGNLDSLYKVAMVVDGGYVRTGGSLGRSMVKYSLPRIRAARSVA
jgi:hypothetical protein